MSQYSVVAVCALLVYVYVHSRQRTRHALNCSYLRRFTAVEVR